MAQYTEETKPNTTKANNTRTKQAKQKTHKMLNVNKHTKTKPKPKPTFVFKNCSRVRVYHCAQLSHSTQHRTEQF